MPPPRTATVPEDAISVTDLVKKLRKISQNISVKWKQFYWFKTDSSLTIRQIKSHNKGCPTIITFISNQIM
jgi:hypothetical protein